MRILIIKLGATGDVVRTTTLLHVLKGKIHWVTSKENAVMLQDIPNIDKCVIWEESSNLKGNQYDLVINLEDTHEVAELLNHITYDALFGAYLNSKSHITYTESAQEWFDLSLISRYGKQSADQLKLENRKSYQEMIFKGLGYTFKGEKYFLPKATKTDLKGDIAIAPKAGSIWPMKNWAYFDMLKLQLEEMDFKVNYLPLRKTLLEHIGDVQNHQYLISGDSLPMHIALGSEMKCMTIFICTSPWEIYDYGRQIKIVSPFLDEFFYKRHFNDKATTSISLDLLVKKYLEHTEKMRSNYL
jgi:heptosyltransferase-2